MDTKANANFEKSRKKDERAQNRFVLAKSLALAISCIVCFGAHAQAGAKGACSSQVDYSNGREPVAETSVSRASGATTLVREQAEQNTRAVAQEVDEKLWPLYSGYQMVEHCQYQELFAENCDEEIYSVWRAHKDFLDSASWSEPPHDDIFMPFVLTFLLGLMVLVRAAFTVVVSLLPSPAKLDVAPQSGFKARNYLDD